jgi:hypothetical protein
MLDVGYMRPKKAAEYLDLAESTLAHLRVTGKGPTYSSRSPKLIFHTKKQCDQWVSSGTRTSTSDVAKIAPFNEEQRASLTFFIPTRIIYSKGKQQYVVAS